MVFCVILCKIHCYIRKLGKVLSFASHPTKLPTAILYRVIGQFQALCKGSCPQFSWLQIDIDEKPAPLHESPSWSHNQEALLQQDAGGVGGPPGRYLAALHESLAVVTFLHFLHTTIVAWFITIGLLSECRLSCIFDLAEVIYRSFLVSPRISLDCWLF